MAGMKTRRIGARPFRFQAAWLTHAQFSKWMEQEWHWEANLASSLNTLTGKLNAWNRDTFGCIFERKKLVKRGWKG